MQELQFAGKTRLAKPLSQHYPRSQAPRWLRQQD
jgi:hypothetical protein